MSGYGYAGANPVREVDPEGMQRREMVMTAPWNPLINEPDGVGGGGLIIIGIGILAAQGDRATQEAGSGMLPHAPASPTIGMGTFTGSASGEATATIVESRENKHGGGKSAQHVGQGAKDAAAGQIAGLEAKLKAVKASPPFEGKKRLLGEIRRQIKHARDKAVKKGDTDHRDPSQGGRR